MIVAVDYDGTFTALPSELLAFINLLKKQGHRVICCTMRTEEEAESIHPALSCMVEVFATSRQAKAEYLSVRGIVPDIWIDDNPRWIYTHAEGYGTIKKVVQDDEVQSL